MLAKDPAPDVSAGDDRQGFGSFLFFIPGKERDHPTAFLLPHVFSFLQDQRCGPVATKLR